MPTRTVEAGPDHGVSLERQPRSKRPRPLLLVAIATAIAVVLLIVTRSGSSSDNVSTTKKQTATDAGRAGVDAGASTAGGAAAGSSAEAAVGGKLQAVKAPVSGNGTPNMPLSVSTSDTAHLRDGDRVRLHVTADKGSEIYALEAFICAAGPRYVTDSDMRPTETGNCAPRPLSANSQNFLQAQGEAPYQDLDTEFRVGTGTVKFATEDGRPVTLTCGSGHPCTLVLKLQYPDAFGLQVIPLTFR